MCVHRRARSVESAALEPWRRNFFAVWPSLFAVSMGLMAFLPMLPIYVRERFHIDDEKEVERWAGLIYGVAPLTAAVLGPLWGSLGDRRGRKAMAIRAIVGIAAVASLMPLASTPLALLGLRALQGALAGYVAPAMSLVSAGTPPDRQAGTIGRLQVALALGLLAGPALGAEVAELFGRPAVFFATSICAALALVPLILFAREDRSSLRSGGPGGFQVWRDLRELFSTEIVGALLAILLLMRLGLQMADAFVQLIVEQLGPLDWVAEQATGRAHAVDRTTAFVFVLHALAQVAFTGVWAKIGDRFGPLRGLAVVCFGLGIATVVSGLVGSIHAFVGCRAAGAVFAAGGATLSYAAFGKRIPAESRSVAFASLQSCMQLGMFSGPLLGGLAADPLGLHGILVLAGCVIVGAGIAMRVLRVREVGGRGRRGTG